jgi:hypothetical protein
VRREAGEVVLLVAEMENEQVLVGGTGFEVVIARSTVEQVVAAARRDGVISVAPYRALELPLTPTQSSPPSP